MSPRPRTPAGDDVSLAEAFFRVGRELRGHTRTSLEPWDLSPSQARALVTVGRHGPMRLSALAGHLRIAPRSATEVVDGLQDHGLVARSPDPADRRATLVAATDDGWAALTALRRARSARADVYFDRLSPADRDTLGRILRELLTDSME